MAATSTPSARWPLASRSSRAPRRASGSSLRGPFPPPPPAGSRRCRSRRCRLLWEASPAPDLAGYLVYRRDPAGELRLLTRRRITATSSSTAASRPASPSPGGHRDRHPGERGRAGRGRARPPVSRLYRLSGAGNDFLALAAPAAAPGGDDRRLVPARPLPRADGLLRAPPRRRRRPDGVLERRRLPARLCLNGTRCAARLAFHLGWRGRRSRSGPAPGRSAPGKVRGHRPRSRSVLRPGAAAPSPRPGGCRHGCAGWLVDAGVRTSSSPGPNARRAPVATLGAALRRHYAFGPGGTKSTFVAFPTPTASRSGASSAGGGRDPRLRHRRLAAVAAGSRRVPRAPGAGASPRAAASSRSPRSPRPAPLWTLTGERPPPRHPRTDPGSHPLPTPAWS